MTTILIVNIVALLVSCNWRKKCNYILSIHKAKKMFVNICSIIRVYCSKSLAYWFLGSLSTYLGLCQLALPLCSSSGEFLQQNSFQTIHCPFRTPAFDTENVQISVEKAIFAFVIGLAYASIWWLIKDVYFILVGIKKEEALMRNITTEAETESLQTAI